MRIVHVVEPFASGIVTFVRSLVENLNEDFHIIIHGERAEVMTFQEAKKLFPKKNVRFIKWQSAQRNISLSKDTAAFVELYTILKKLKSRNLIDAVHLHSSKGGFLGRFACKLLNIENVVYTPNGAPFFVGKNNFSNFIYKKLEKIASGFGGQVVCCSSSEQEAYEEIGIHSITINNGISQSHIPVLPKFAKSGNKFQVISCGRIAHQKNPALFNAIAEYFEDLPSFEFIWAGDGNRKNELTAKNIRVTGWLSAKQTRALVNQADVYLSTSNFEGLSFSVLEAMTLKKPVLLTDCVGNKDIVKLGMNGDLFVTESDAINKILRYYNNPEMLHVLGSNSQKICSEEFDADDTSGKYRMLYQPLAAVAAAQTNRKS
jgi:glycosyltransferase involved in cell wall biosynthesis